MNVVFVVSSDFDVDFAAPFDWDEACSSPCVAQCGRLDEQPDASAEIETNQLICLCVTVGTHFLSAEDRPATRYVNMQQYYSYSRAS